MHQSVHAFKDILETHSITVYLYNVSIKFKLFRYIPFKIKKLINLTSLFQKKKKNQQETRAAHHLVAQTAPAGS